MAEETSTRRQPKFWIGLIALIILLIFLYFYKPFETYLVAHIPGIHFSNVVFWFASLVGIVGYVISHWQSFRGQFGRDGGALNVETLLFDSLQVSILVAVIFCAGGTLQAVAMLGEHLVGRGAIVGGAAGEKLLAIILMVILAILFYLLHHLVRAFRDGWTTRRAPPRRSASLSD
ncbi:MAG: hypothetical protein OSB82_13080 [Alphaproteobacteria bacterium]|nr:hypothetical protein [Alphaproteobacteria bacterium]